jgi:hypothetical protein
MNEPTTSLIYHLAAAKRINAAVKRFLGYYLDPENSLDYAVMIDGPWGSGKTHLIRSFLDGNKDVKPLYVSLYGLTKVSQIEDEFYRQLHPVFSSKGMKLAGAVARGLLKTTVKIDLDGDGTADGSVESSVPQLDLGKIGDPKGRLLVFDDIERCRIPISELLGFINSYVEHDGLKAVLIAHEERLRELDEKSDDAEKYDGIKEKLVGQTLSVEPEIGPAFKHFLTLIKNPEVREFLDGKRETIFAVHAQSRTRNLRLLKHAMWDFEKFALHFFDRHWAKEVVIEKALQAIVALSIESRSNQLDERTIEMLVSQQIGRLMQKHLGKDPTRADTIEASYSLVDFSDTVIPAELLSAGLLRGDIDPSAIGKALDANPHYTPPAEQPLWLRAINVYVATDDEADEIVGAVERAFENMEVTSRGELLHLFGARLWFAKLGLIERAADEVVEDAQDYIARLKVSGQIEEPMKDYTDGDESHFGYRVIEEESAEWKQIASIYGAAAKEVREATYPEIGKDILVRLETEPDEVLLDLVLNQVRLAPYHDEPVLAVIDPKVFAERVIELAPRLQMGALEMLKSRHEMNPPGLAKERFWVAEVELALLARLEDLHALTQARLKGSIARNLKTLREASDDLGEVSDVESIE